MTRLLAGAAPSLSQWASVVKELIAGLDSDSLETLHNHLQKTEMLTVHVIVGLSLFLRHNSLPNTEETHSGGKQTGAQVYASPAPWDMKACTGSWTLQ